MLPVVLDWAWTPTSRPILSRSNDACTQDLIDIQHLLSVILKSNQKFISRPRTLE
jgi:hypothetical protein